MDAFLCVLNAMLHHIKCLHIIACSLSQMYNADNRTVFYCYTYWYYISLQNLDTSI